MASSSYQELVTSNPDLVAKGRNTILDFYKYKQSLIHWDKPITVYWIFGGPGTGKTFSAVNLAREVAGNSYFIHLPGSLKWWDGYNNQKCVIIDDFRRSQLSDIGGLSYLLRILDRYDLSLEVKGGSVVREFEYVIITCPDSPVGAFTYHREDDNSVIDENIGQLIRRIFKIVELRPIMGVVEEIDHTDTLKRQYCLPEGTKPVIRRCLVAPGEPGVLSS